MKLFYICLILFGICFSNVFGRTFESNGRIDTEVENFRTAIANTDTNARTQHTIRLLSANPDPTMIKVNGNSGRVTVTPRGFEASPSRDTINLEWALNNFGEVKLQPGTFHLDRTIEIVDFVGTLKGSGANVTIIAGRGPQVGANYEFPILTQDLKDRVYPSGAPHLMWFHSTPHANPNDWVDHQTDLTIRDLTIRIDGVGPQITLQQQPLRTVWGMVVVTGPNASFVVPGGNVPSARVSIKNVNFVAQDVSYNLGSVLKTHSNAAAGLVIYGGEAWTSAVDALNGWTEYNHAPINCRLTIEGSTFTNLHQFAYAAEGFTTSDPTGPYGYPTDPVFPRAFVDVSDNVFYNVGNGAGLIGTGGYTNLLVGNSDTDIQIVDNYFMRNPAMAVAVLQGVADDMAKIPYPVTISDNVFHMISGDYSVAAIFILDINALSGNTIITVSDNEFYGESGFAKYHVLSLMGKQLTVMDNTFHGTAAGAVALSPANIFNPADPPLPTLAAVVEANNFSDMISFGPKIFIGKGAYYCHITVTSASDYYDDNGATSTNVVTVSP